MVSGTGSLSSGDEKEIHGGNRPAGTGVGVERLAYPDCLCEIAVQLAIP